MPAPRAGSPVSVPIGGEHGGGAACTYATGVPATALLAAAVLMGVPATGRSELDTPLHVDESYSAHDAPIASVDEDTNPKIAV